MNNEEKQARYKTAEKLIAEQNFTAAVIAGAVATILAAVTYGIVVAKWRFSYGFAAVGIGIAVGLSMRFLGRGIATRFAWTAAVYTLVGCCLGSLFRVVVARAMGRRISPVDVLRDSPLSEIAGRAISNFALVELVYWFIAVYFAVFLVNRSLSRAEKLAMGLHEMRD